MADLRYRSALNGIQEVRGSTPLGSTKRAAIDLICLGPVPIAATTRCLIQAAQEGLDHGGVVLAERGAMGGD
jgi:hypothetical protein